MEDENCMRIVRVCMWGDEGVWCVMYWWQEEKGCEGGVVVCGDGGGGISCIGLWYGVFPIWCDFRGCGMQYSVDILLGPSIILQRLLFWFTLMCSVLPGIAALTTIVTHLLSLILLLYGCSYHLCFYHVNPIRCRLFCHCSSDCLILVTQHSVLYHVTCYLFYVTMMPVE